MNIKFKSTDHALPHITIITGKTKSIEKIYKKLKKSKIKKFKLKSPGMGIFANKEPNLYIRWEQSLELLKASSKIAKETSKFFYKIKQNSNNSQWVPKTTLAWKDLKYDDLNHIKSLIRINRLYYDEKMQLFVMSKKFQFNYKL